MSITEIKQHAMNIKNGNTKVQPGELFRLNEAASIGDGAWQGDLGIEIVNEQEIYDMLDAQPRAQLVPGTTIGSRHMIHDLSTISYFRLPIDWNADDYEGLGGPVFLCHDETTISHPTHGDVIIAAGHTIRCRYQREHDEEQRRERRALD